MEERLTFQIPQALDDLNACADAAKQCAELFIGVRLTIRTITWSGERVGLGTKTTSDLVLPPRFPAKQLSAREVAASGGKYNFEDIRILNISPHYDANGGGGFRPVELDPARALSPGTSNVEVLYLIEGSVQGTFSLVAIDTTDPTAYFLVLRRTRRTPQ